MLVFAAVLAVRAAISQRDVGRAPAAVEATSFVSSWRELLGVATHVLGPDDAPFTAVAILDLECPASAGLHRTLTEMVDSGRDQIAIYYVHAPLEYHRHALSAAKIGVCAGRQGELLAWTNTVLSKQDSIGRKSWLSYAQDARLRDPEGVLKCAEDLDNSLIEITLPLRVISANGIRFMPVLLLEGWHVPGAPSVGKLEKVMAELQLEKPPN
jgi:protein-disulfide isomerase